jgi:dienelactone hydrolase
MYMPYHDVNITVPAIDQDATKYEYAGDNALVAIPAACYQKEKSFFAAHAAQANLADRTPDGPDGMFYFRMNDPDTEYAKLATMTDCSCGLVVLLHGTSGVRWNPVSYAATLSGLGYVVVLPDSQSQPAELGYKGAISLKNTSEIDTSNYCGAMDSYKERAGTWSKPFMYSTKTANVLHNGMDYAEYSERNYRIRALEMDAFVSKRESLLSAFSSASKVFLLGRSEGGAVAGRYYNEALHSKLSGIILSGWSCDFNYFVSCAENARICENKCSKSIPVLNVVGETDGYFAASGSVSADVAAGTNGYGGPITGNCKASMDAQGFSGFVVVMEGAGHGILYTHDNAWRSVLADFVANPTAASLPSLQRSGCQEQGGVYTCDALSESRPCFSNYTVDTSVPFATGTSSCGDSIGPASEEVSMAARAAGALTAVLGPVAALW